MVLYAAGEQTAGMGSHIKYDDTRAVSRQLSLLVSPSLQVHFKARCIEVCADGCEDNSLSVQLV